MSQHYSQPEREDDEHALPDLEVFYRTQRACIADGDIWNPEDCDQTNAACYYNGSGDCQVHQLAGWYYWYCFPGCLPDSDPVGPFKSEAEALADAHAQAEE